MSDLESDLCDNDIVIYPYPHGTPFDNHDDAHLVNFSKKSIEKLNKDEGKKFEFVELKEGLLYRAFEYDTITAYFEAGDHDGKIMTFRAFTGCPFEGSLEHCVPRSVLPLSDYEAQNLEKGLKQLQVEIMTSLLDRMNEMDDGMDDGTDGIAMLDGIELFAGPYT